MMHCIRRIAAMTCFLCISSFLSCEKPGGIAAKKEKTDWRLTLASDDKGPYGIAIAHSALKFYFPAAEHKDLRRTFQYTSIGAGMEGGTDSISLLVLAGFSFHVTDDEWARILSYASSGNEVIIFSSRFDELIQSQFEFKTPGNPDETDRPPLYDLAANRSVLRLKSDSTKSYGYTGRHIRSFFQWENDPETTMENAADEENNETGSSETYNDQIASRKVLGSADGKADFVRYDAGLGHITLHAAPLVLSNYFLLQPGNREYLDGIWHTMPANISKVFWHEFYNRNAGHSDMGVLWRHPATRAALLLFIIGMVLYVLFSMKRRQRIIPIVKPVENTSVQFVETIGRLYYNQGVHSNLAEKMTQHFLEWVRSVYYLDTSVLNEPFTAALAAKSGFPVEEVRKTVTMLIKARTGNAADENYLYALHAALQKFYSRHPYSLL